MLLLIPEKRLRNIFELLCQVLFRMLQPCSPEFTAGANKNH